MQYAASGGLDCLRLVDLNTVEVVDTPTRRDQLWPLGPTDAILAGGTWLFSEPQTHLRRLGVVAGGGMVAIIALAMP